MFIASRSMIFPLRQERHVSCGPSNHIALRWSAKPNLHEAINMVLLRSTLQRSRHQIVIEP